jgi:predicted transcriptional regulator
MFVTEIKQKVIDVINNLPDDATLDDILETLTFQKEVLLGLDQLDQGEYISHEEVQAEIAQRQKKRKK